MKYQLKQLLFGIIAGSAIALGSFLFIILKTYVPGEYGHILSSLIFSVGLFLVCTFSLSLFTGKIGLVFEKRQESRFYISLPVMLIGNAIGAIGLGYICFFIFNGTDLFNTAKAVSELRTIQFETLDPQGFLSALVKGLACGLCVYLAVKSFAYNRLKPVGILLLIFFVFLFVYFGFEHCIANMFYFSMANLWTGEAFLDLFLIIVANSLGTIPGVFMLKLFLKKE